VLKGKWVDINGIIRNIVVIGLNDCLFCFLGALDAVIVHMKRTGEMEGEVDICDDLRS